MDRWKLIRVTLCLAAMLALLAAGLFGRREGPPQGTWIKVGREPSRIYARPDPFAIMAWDLDERNGELADLDHATYVMEGEDPDTYQGFR